MSQTKMAKEWERTVLLELQREHARICKERKVFLRPLLFRIEELDSTWAQYDSWIRTVTFSKKLIHEYQWFQVLGVLRHQMAHQYTAESGTQSLKDARTSTEKFQAACRKLGVPPQFSNLGIRLQNSDLDWRQEKQDPQTERTLEKIRKLLSLAQSSNEHEALLAMTRVREIYARLNLDHMQSRSKDEFVHLVISTGKKRFEAWELKTLSILIAYFFVRVLTLEQFEVSTCEKKQAFELIGTRENVLMAEYVYHFLIQQVEHLIDQMIPAKGRKFSRIEKNSYRLGILDGFSKKLASSLKIVAPVDPDSKSLMVVRALSQFQKDPLLTEYLGDIYPGLAQRPPPSATVDAQAFEDGHKAGHKINLHKPLNEKQGGFGGLLTTSAKAAD
jgi:hypothetical protein